MVKINRQSEELIEDTLDQLSESEDNLESKSDQNLDSKPKDISFQLAKNKGLAVFRFPVVMDLIAAEIETNGVNPNGTFTPDYYRALAKRCCLKWGDKSDMPDEDKIRLSDDNNMVIALSQYVGSCNIESQDVESYSTVLDSDGDFDIYEIKVNPEIVLV